ncbi:hypothetical protein U1Q18_036997 [Sarracenia purpurea var. burkii]
MSRKHWLAAAITLYHGRDLFPCPPLAPSSPPIIAHSLPLRFCKELGSLPLWRATRRWRLRDNKRLRQLSVADLRDLEFGFQRGPQREEEVEGNGGGDDNREETTLVDRGGVGGRGLEGGSWGWQMVIVVEGGRGWWGGFKRWLAMTIGKNRLC